MSMQDAVSSKPSLEQALGKELLAYCDRYDIPVDRIVEILEDQKVLPMIRGKATEYNATAALASLLDQVHWQVNKLNPNPQPGRPDEDIEIIHRKTKTSIVVETKSAVRGSMTTGRRCRIIREPHFKVKCHRSRSNLQMAATSNDRYAADSWDILISNPYNAIIKGSTSGRTLELVDEESILEMLYSHYGVCTPDELSRAASKDWRFVLPIDIAEEGFIPRTPSVLLSQDPNWHPLDELQEHLEVIVRRKTQRHS
jgi:hypothetical protein